MPLALQQVPMALIVFRLGVAIGLPILAHAAPEARVHLVTLIWLALLSDIFDGVIARRVGCDTDDLRRLDSAIDALFWFVVLGVTIALEGGALLAWWPWILGLVAGEVIIYVVNQRRFGRAGATHAYSAKLFGLGLLAGFTEVLLTGTASGWFALMIGLGYIALVDVLLIALLLPRWRRDVPSAWHAYLIGRAV